MDSTDVFSIIIVGATALAFFEIGLRLCRLGKWSEDTQAVCGIVLSATVGFPVGRFVADYFAGEEPKAIDWGTVNGLAGLAVVVTIAVLFYRWYEWTGATESRRPRKRRGR